MELNEEEMEYVRAAEERIKSITIGNLGEPIGPLVSTAIFVELKHMLYCGKLLAKQKMLDVFDKI